MTKKENIIIANLYNRQGMKPSDITDVIDWWFDTQVDPLKAIHLSYCLSSNTINTYRVSIK